MVNKIYFQVEEKNIDDMLNKTYNAKEDGGRPAEEFLKSLEPKMLAKMLKITELLEEFGMAMRLPYSEYLEDGIFEIRVKQGSNITRVLYFFMCGKRLILTNGFY